MNVDESRATRALSDVVAVERVAPGMVNVITWSDTHTVDARGEGCTCPDKQYNLGPGEKCKHHAAAVLATTDLPAPFDLVDDVTRRPVATDGGADRPDGCACDGLDDATPCFACHMAGFETSRGVGA